jgi:hypothetical protein
MVTEVPMSILTSNSIKKLTHKNFHTWEPLITAELQHMGVWCMCTGDEAHSLMKPSPMSLPDTVTVSKRISAQRNHADALRAYEAACHCNDQAIGMIKTHIEPLQFEGIDKLTTAKEV